jgi:hypothetical protein
VLIFNIHLILIFLNDKSKHSGILVFGIYPSSCMLKNTKEHPNSSFFNHLITQCYVLSRILGVAWLIRRVLDLMIGFIGQITIWHTVICFRLDTPLEIFRLPTELRCTPSYSCILRVRVRVRVTLRLSVYRQSVRLGDNPLRLTTRILFFPNWTLVVIALT